MLVLTSCTGSESTPVKSSTTKPIQKEDPVKNPNDTHQDSTTKSSIDTANPPEDTSDNSSDENEATEDPKEALTKILTELQELDELLNGTD